MQGEGICGQRKLKNLPMGIPEGGLGLAPPGPPQAAVPRRPRVTYFLVGEGARNKRVFFTHFRFRLSFPQYLGVGVGWGEFPIFSQNIHLRCSVFKMCRINHKNPL